MIRHSFKRGITVPTVMIAWLIQQCLLHPCFVILRLPSQGGAAVPTSQCQLGAKERLNKSFFHKQDQISKDVLFNRGENKISSDTTLTLFSRALVLLLY